MKLQKLMGIAFGLCLGGTLYTSAQGMVKPSPDCTPSPNSGWLPMPERVDGFSQVHVSGTGGGPKYGNILVTPFCNGMDQTQHLDYRAYENIRLGYYDTLPLHLSR